MFSRGAAEGNIESRSKKKEKRATATATAVVGQNWELTKRGRRRLRGLYLKIQVRVIHITKKLFHVVSR